jgi:hypothetical protein
MAPVGVAGAVGSSEPQAPAEIRRAVANSRQRRSKAVRWFGSGRCAITEFQRRGGSVLEGCRQDLMVALRCQKAARRPAP